MSEIPPSDIQPTPSEILLMFYGSNTSPAPTSKLYTGNAEANAGAANLMSNVTAANEREAKRRAALEAAREKKRQLKTQQQNTEE